MEYSTRMGEHMHDTPILKLLSLSVFPSVLLLGGFTFTVFHVVCISAPAVPHCESLDAKMRELTESSYMVVYSSGPHM